MKITLLQKCGLGNQLFQYAAALYYAARYNASVEVIRDARIPAWELRKREFLLAKLAISAPVRDLRLYDRVMTSIAPHKAPIAMSARFLTRTHVYRQPTETDRSFIPDLTIPSGTRSLYLEGFFQAWQFAASIEPQLRREFAFREPPPGANLDLLRRIEQSDCPVSIHVRRGDYTVMRNGGNLLSIRYFVNAMDAIRQRIANPVWFVFSNDIPWARANLPAAEVVYFAEGNDEDHGHEDLRLMAACHHHIIANSTFSWWGAWLNPRPDRIVCAPEIWLDPNTPAPDITPPQWLRIPIS